MSGEALHRAATLIRERAAAAMPGRWEVYETFTHRCVGVTRHGRRRQVAQATEAHPGSAEHIASWQPSVALAVADLLDNLAEAEERNYRELGFSPIDTSDALAVARTYLGDPS